LQLRHLVGNIYYVPGASNVGLAITKEGQALLIDTGVGARSGRRLLQILQDHDLQLAAIFNTHCHGDHVGGNAFLVEHTGARVYAPPHDAIVIEKPVWGTMCMFGGADPLAELEAPRFAAQACQVDVRVSEGVVVVGGTEVQVVPLPGHTGSHTGYVIEDVFFTGDILAGEEELAQSPITYAYSITMRLQSLEKLQRYCCAYYVLGHGNPEQDIQSLIERNIEQVDDVLAFIQAFLTQGCADIDQIYTAVCRHYGITVRTLKQYFLLYPTLHSYISHLSRNGDITHAFEANRLLWCLPNGR
jgi:glyoxylase-like metal-dependent hydrolase (beta-lactamase superfamily II)